MLKAPRNALQIGVRAVETRRAWGIMGSWGSSPFPQPKSAVADFGHFVQWPNPRYSEVRLGRGRGWGSANGARQGRNLRHPPPTVPHKGGGSRYAVGFTIAPRMDVRVPAPLLLNQLLLRQLADAGARQRGAGFHGGRHLMATDLVGEEIAQRVERQGRSAGPQLDEGLGGFAPIRVSNTDHQRFLDVRVFVDRLLDHLRIDIEATRKDHVLLAVENEEVAVLVHGADVAGEKTAVREGGSRVVRPIPVALHHVLALDPQLAGPKHTARIVERHPLDRDPG